MARFFLSLLMLLPLMAVAQVPNGINYQAVARDANGLAQANQNISVRFTILAGGPLGTQLYQETHTTTTNDLGLFTLVVGNGQPTSGTFADIPWEGRLSLSGD